MINARFEFVQTFKDKIVKCATITLEYWTEDIPSPSSIQKWSNTDLKCDYTPEEYKQFLEKLDFEYDNGFGLQQLFGVVWFEDGTWATRGEYDGSEWWEVHEIPEIPDHLKIR